MQEPGIALLGLGPWGRNHLRVLSELGCLRAVHDPDPERAARADPALRAPDHSALLADPAVRGVVIATPARTHAALAREALLAGKDVFVEKPLTLDLEEGEDLVALARARQAVLMVGHVTLFHPAIVTLRGLVSDGALGRLRYLYANRLNRGTVREEEDILWSFAPHDFGVFLELAGGPPQRVVAHGGRWLRGDRADLTVTHLEWEGNVRGHVFVSWLHPMKEHRLVVIGDERMAVFTDGLDGGRLTLHAPADPPMQGVPRVAAEEEAIAFPRAEPLAEELAHFVACLRSRGEPRTGGVHGLQVLRMLDAARTSLEQEVPVRLAGPRAGSPR